MGLYERKEAFIALGKKLNELVLEDKNQENATFEKDVFYTDFKQAISLAYHKNGWFTKENILLACKSWAEVLNRKLLDDWLSSYPIEDTPNIKNVLIVMAGNIPLVGFHDFLSVLICGHKAIVKLSSNDTVLLPVIATYLQSICDEFENKIQFTQERVSDFDAVIATGSNNSARYFEYYFGKKPHIIRKNRNSVAIFSGKESQEELTALGNDIFQYFGLGCRSVSKIFVPKDYDFSNFFQAIYSFYPIIEQKKYENNYDYNKAVYLMSLFKIQENGFLLLKEDKGYASPIATLFYEYYEDINSLIKKIEEDKEHIQCVVSKGIVSNEIDFGETQKPSLWDYADNVDTIEFLQSLR